MGRYREDEKKDKYDTKRLSVEEMEDMLVELDAQIERFSLEMEYEVKLTAFRESYEGWYAGRITLGECLQRMMDSMKLCQDIGVWRNRRE